ncbi:ELWxxDGT repeat protein [Haloferula sp. BvORR071]|uniref:ELWxxDGT repeat protein n=1 Tax=Haloferula sp. BvORR071 TaxID=1396141 RepID=UPI002241046C|nr:ELWxxDGT repeat protein [Haloferula sp. BvORR071]
MDRGISSLYQVGERIYFFGSESSHGSELWTSDGTPTGTRLVKDLKPGTSLSGIGMVGQVNGILLFYVADADVKGLWRSDGTAEGTFQIASPLGGNGLIQDGLYWFYAGQAEDQLWRTDGTLAGTFAVTAAPAAARAPRSSVSQPYYPPYDTPPTLKHIAGLGDDVYFATKAGRLLKSSGTSESTFDLGTPSVAILDLRPAGSWISTFCDSWDWRAFRGNEFVKLVETQTWSDARDAGGWADLHFVALLNSTTYRWWLWSSDGTPAGTKPLKQLPYAAKAPTAFAVRGQKLYFVADDERLGAEPWVSDGSPEGTHLLKDINRGEYGSQVSGFHQLGNEVYFSANDGKQRRLWRTDGSLKGTKPLAGQAKGLNVSSISITHQDDSLYFPAVKNGYFGLWQHNVATRKSSELTRLGAGTGNALQTSSDYGDFHIVPFGDSAVFLAGDGRNNTLYISDGTAAGTLPLETVPRNSWGWSATDHLVLGDQILFLNKEKSRLRRRTLHVSDGSARSAKLIPGIPAKTYPAYLTDMVRSGEWAYLMGDREIWASRGDAPGTFSLFKSDSIVSTSLVAGPGGAFFQTTDRSLWNADAESGQVARVRDGSSWLYKPEHLHQLGNLLLFTDNHDLWRSDGTNQGTSKIKALGDGYLSGFTVSGDFLWFTVGYELWRSDGTEAGTFAVATFGIGIGELGAGLENSVFFSGWDENHGWELWTSDGTPEGTRLLKDIAPGSARSSSPGSFALVGDTIYFAAEDGIHGRELWKSDGSEAGTFMVADLTGDSGSSSPMRLARVGEQLFFDATTVQTGREIFAMDVSADLQSQ